MVKLGSVEIDTNIFLAPLAGCSDLAFRMICREYGAGFCFFEMMDANSLVRRNMKKADIIKTAPEDMPIAGQILCAEPDIALAAALRLLELVNISFLDINFACPAKKAIRKKAGAHLLRDIATMHGIIARLTRSLHIPVTVKMRIGFDSIDHDAISETARRLEDAGAAALFVHGRTRQQGYHGEIDYRSIAAIKEAVRIPVFGSGNILDVISAKRMFDETGCDGILVARGAFGNPWIFQDIAGYVNAGNPAKARNRSEKIKMLKQHLSYIDLYKEARQSSKVGYMRKVCLWYIKEFPQAARIRERIGRAKSYYELVGIADGAGA